MAANHHDSPRFYENRNWIMLALVLLVAGIALLVFERRVAPPPPPLEAPDGEPDFFMEGAVISQFGPEGYLQYRLAAREIRHFEREGLTRMQHPQLALHQEDEPPWQISARIGIIHQPEADGAEKVELQGDVVLEQILRRGERVSLSSQSMILYPDRQYAETDDDVMITTHIGQTMATGLKGDFRLGTISLLSLGDTPVHTVLEPEHFK
ncbi:MAG: LPS export ABC transporter periplasmic protein LptC [Pseudomonadales bacterium]